MLLKHSITTSNFIQERGREKSDTDRQTDRYLKDQGKENIVTLCLSSIRSDLSIQQLKECQQATVHRVTELNTTEVTYNIRTEQFQIICQLQDHILFIPISKKGSAKECSNHLTIALISHTNKVMLKILQDRLQQYVKCELPEVSWR